MREDYVAKRCGQSKTPGAGIITPAVSRQIVRFVAAERLSVQTRNETRESDGDWEDVEGLRVGPSLFSLVCRELNRSSKSNPRQSSKVTHSVSFL
jgi:hypothetical protein